MLSRTETAAAGQNYATQGLFVGPVDHMATVVAKLSTLSTKEIDSNGLLVPGTPFKKDGTLITRKPGVHQVVAAGGVAGALTATGVAVGDQLLAVINLADGVDLLGETSITGADEITTTTTDTSADLVLVTFEVEDAVFGVVSEPVSVADNNSNIAGISNREIVVATIGQVNKDLAEDNLGRAYSANEILAFASAGSNIHLLD